ncbi:DUF4870 domain-containing protein [Heliobacterium mobile]|uniref:DUF4870 domain-containing protein n=1 Tax=Heliobacterium mobile TaxID=28064 RepID=UPI0038B2873F
MRKRICQRNGSERAFATLTVSISDQLLNLIYQINLICSSLQAILTIIASEQVNDGKHYRYPFIFRLIK